MTDDESEIAQCAAHQNLNNLYIQLRHIVYEQGQAVSQLCDENERLRELLFRIESHYECPDNEEDDTQEAFDFREVVCRIKKEVLDADQGDE